MGTMDLMGLALTRSMFADFLTDTCRITERPDRETSTWDPVDAVDRFTAPAVIYEGPCLVQTAAGHRTTTQAATEVIVEELTLAVPTTATGIKVGHLVTITGRDFPLVVHRAPLPTNEILRRVTLRRTQALRQGVLA